MSMKFYKMNILKVDNFGTYYNFRIKKYLKYQTYFYYHIVYTYNKYCFLSKL